MGAHWRSVASVIPAERRTDVVIVAEQATWQEYQEYGGVIAVPTSFRLLRTACCAMLQSMRPMAAAT